MEQCTLCDCNASTFGKDVVVAMELPSKPLAVQLLFVFAALTVCSGAVEPVAQQADPESKPKELVSESIFGQNRFPRQSSGSLVLPSLMAPTTQMSEIGNGQVPGDQAALAMNFKRPLPEGFDREDFVLSSSYRWHAANTFSHPLYFEDAMLERHGHSCAPCVQPLMSGARFFATMPILPYLMTVQRPCDNYYSLGHFRVGSRAPKLLQRPPYQRDAALKQALWTAAAVLVIP